MAEDFQEFVQRVKAANPLEDVIDETGPEYRLQRKHGNYLRGEAHDSLVVRVDEQYFVWNERSEKGDVFTWLEKRRKFDFMEGLKYLAQRAKMEMPAEFQAREELPRRLASRAREELLGIVQRVLAERLWKDAEALAYARGRGWSDETIRAAGLGFTGRGTEEELKDVRGELQMHGHHPEGPLAVAVLGFRGDVRGWARDHGVEAQKNWGEWGFVPGLVGKMRLVYPHWESGRVVYLSGRNILGAEVNREGRTVKAFNLPKALAGPRRVFYNQAYGRRAETCVAVEGQADAITLGQWEVAGMALAGTQWTDHEETLKELVKRHTRLYVGLDMDEAGVRALQGEKGDWPLGRILGPMARVVRWDALTPEPSEKIKDANDWLRAMVEEGVEGEEQKKRVGAALAGAKTLAESAAAWAGKKRGAERDEAIRTAFGLIAKLDRFGRADQRQRLCELLGVGIREFNELLKAAGESNGEDERPLVFEETLGGFIKGWLVEYLYDPEAETAKLAYRDPEGRVGEAEHIEIEGIRYIPRRANEFMRSGGVLFPSELGPLKDTKELTATVEAFIRKWYLLDSRWLGRIIAYYVLMTWVYDCFEALPYLRALGEAGGGKSELMRRVGSVCYRMISANGAGTAATFFRITEKYRGTVFIDEADLRDGGDMTNDLVKFLNLGAMRGNPITRLAEVQTENGKDWEETPYNTFCPKLIAMRKDFRDDAVGSRSLTIKVMPREPLELVRAGVPLVVGEEFRRQAMKIRNLLLRWRLHMWRERIEVGEEHIDLEISSRLNQVTMPIKALAAGDPELSEEIERFLRAYNAEMVLSRSMSIAARVVEALWKIYKYGDLRTQYLQVTQAGDEFMMIGDVRKIANEIMDEMNRGGEEEEDEEGKRRRKKDELSARGVGSIIRNELQLRVGERSMKGYPVYWDEVKMMALGKRYGVNYAAIGIASNNGNGPGTSMTARPPGQARQADMNI